MENQRQLDGPGEDLQKRTNAGTSMRVRPQYTEAAFPEVIEGSDFSLLLEYWDILRRRKGTIVLIAFLGFLASLLYTLPQTPLYQARAFLEIQSLNRNFLNMHDVSPTANEGSSSPEYDLQTEAKILQSESVLERVVAKLNLEKRLSLDNKTGRLSAWLSALGLPGSKPALTREEAVRLVARNLKVRPEANTRLVEILYDSTDPQLAADVVNSLTSEFIQKNLEVRWKTTQQTGEWLTGQMQRHPDQAREIRRPATELCPRFRPAVYFGERQRRRGEASPASGGTLQGTGRSHCQTIEIRAVLHSVSRVPPRSAR